MKKIHVSSQSNLNSSQDYHVRSPINSEKTEEDTNTNNYTKDPTPPSQNTTTSGTTVLATKLEARTTNDHIELTEQTPQITNDPSGSFFD